MVYSQVVKNIFLYNNEPLLTYLRAEIQSLIEIIENVYWFRFRENTWYVCKQADTCIAMYYLVVYICFIIIFENDQYFVN